MKQLTKEQAITLFESKQYEQWPDEKAAWFQLNQDLLCMEFSYFHKVIEKCLNRPVYTHEFGLNREGLKAEFQGLINAPSFEVIVGLIPSDKLVIFV